MDNYNKTLLRVKKPISQNVSVDTNISNDIKLNTIPIFNKTISIIVDDTSEYNIINEKLYHNNQIVSGNYYIVVSNNEKYNNKAWKVIEGNLTELDSYFDGTNSKLIINNKEINENGLIILTDDAKLYFRINNLWFIR